MFPDACPTNALVEVDTATESYVTDDDGADDTRRRRRLGLDDDGWDSASIEVALNGEDWTDIDDVLYVRRCGDVL